MLGFFESFSTNLLDNCISYLKILSTPNLFINLIDLAKAYALPKCKVANSNLFADLLNSTLLAFKSNIFLWVLKPNKPGINFLFSSSQIYIIAIPNELHNHL